MKYILAVLITALIVGLGVTAYFKGWLAPPNFIKPQAASVANTEVSTTQQNQPTAPAQISPTPVSIPVAALAVQAGGVSNLKTYSINVPSDWQSSKDGSVPGQIDSLTLTKDSYKIVISQAAFGGGGCVYPGDPDTPMSQRFTGFTAITDMSGDNLRVGILQTGGMAVCQGSNGGWGDITSFGHITITTPATPDQAALDQINSMLQSLKKI